MSVCVRVHVRVHVHARVYVCERGFSQVFTQTDPVAECPNAKKCRARYGMEQQSQWCKPCR